MNYATTLFLYYKYLFVYRKSAIKNILHKNIYKFDNIYFYNYVQSFWIQLFFLL